MTQSKTKLTYRDQAQRRDDRISCIRLRLAIGRALEDRGITTASNVGEALGMPAKDAQGLLSRRQWREGDVAALQQAAARLGVEV